MNRTNRAVMIGLLAALGFLVGMFLARDGLTVENGALLLIGFSASIVLLLDDQQRKRRGPNRCCDPGSGPFVA
ncbi:MAG: hypothetical protein ACF8SC_01525 [Phycisphaerales bacterium JB037]